MIDIDRWQEIYFVIRHHKLRTALTAFGVFWGIFMLVVLLGAGRGLERGALDDFGGHTNTIFLWSGGKTQIPYQGLGLGRRINLKDADVAIVRALPEVDLISSVNDLGGWQAAQYIVRGKAKGTFNTRGVEPDIFALANYSLPLGRALNDLDFEQKRKVAVIGSSVQEMLFEASENPVGHYLEISDVSFRIVGVFAAPNTGSGGRDDAERILLPNSTLRQTFNQTGWIGHLQISPVEGVHAVDLEQKVRRILHERHRVHLDDTGVIGTWNAQKEYEKAESLFEGIRIFSWIVAVGTVIAGVVGVGNIMLIVVKERTREIGLRKALGATSGDIIVTIVQEALVLTTIAGYFGLVGGVLVLELVSPLLASSQGGMFGRADIELSTAAFALLALVSSGLLAAILPASKAARVNPIVALQDE
ncbi:MAG: hypothetical protein COA42_02035 [Alteromonadaceae bacterium]|nr:MAG: hypothetical protein COA42_02035 [Alteromonadaceae bacterium]